MSLKRGKLKKQKIHFAGILANVDSSILQVKLSHGFQIQAIPLKKGLALFCSLENLPQHAVGPKLFNEYPCYNTSEEKYYVVHNSFLYEYQTWNESQLFSEIMKFDGKSVETYLDSVCRLMRLFKEGNVCIPLTYYFFVKRNLPKRFLGKATHRYISPELYTLDTSEIADLEVFIENTKIPFKQDFLQLAFESYELSYETRDINLAFLSLMAALEALFNPGDQEITYRISRNTAVLLGQDKNNSADLFREVKQLYSKRSQIIHRGERIATGEDLIKLRSYVRDSIKQIYRVNKSKDDIMDMLNSLGFGQKP